MPYVQRIPDRILRSEWATRIAQQLRIEEPVLRESMRKAANEPPQLGKGLAGTGRSCRKASGTSPGPNS